MRRCQKMPSHWNARGQWHNRWHALFCPECRSARKADQKLARGARALRQPPLPPELRAQIFERLGLPPAEALSQAHARDPWMLPRFVTLPASRQPRLRRAALSIGAAAAALLFAATSLWLVRSAHHRKLSSPPVPLVQRPPLPTNRPRLRPSAPPARNEAGPQFAQLPLQPSGGGSGAGPVPSPLVGIARKKGAAHEPPVHLQVNAHQPAPWHPSAAVDDLAYLNEDPGATVRRWAPMRADEWHTLEAQIRRTIHVRDDFVQIPFPLLASTSERQIAEAVEQYKKEAAIIDPRLSREVTLAVKAMAFSDLCDRLSADTGIKISAGRSVADEKATLFCENRALRQIMREINHVFGFTWLRSGKEGHYRYELAQDLKSQLAEEELRNRDRNEALTALDEQMKLYRPYLDESPEQLRTAVDRASGTERHQLMTLAQPGVWGGLHLYNRLTPAQMTALRSGQMLYFAPEGVPVSTIMGTPVESTLPAAWRPLLLESLGTGEVHAGDTAFLGLLMPGEEPGAAPWLRLRINSTELGQLSLEVEAGVILGTGGGRSEGRTLAVAQSPSAARPDNAHSNQALRSRPPFSQEITVQPKPSCPMALMARRMAPATLPDGTGSHEAQPADVRSADVWEAIHRATGLPIIADSCMHLYDRAPVTMERVPLFEALCRVGDVMGVRWREESGFLLCRSTSYFWDKLKEVPNRYLQRWLQDSQAKGGLPLDDLLEMATRPDQQLDSEIVSQAIRHCWGLEEWHLVGPNPLGVPSDTRIHARLLAALTPEQRQQALGEPGLPLNALAPAQQQSLLPILSRKWMLPLDRLMGARYHVDYVPAGRYVWIPSDPKSAYERPIIADRSAKNVLAAALRLDPSATPDQIRLTTGVLAAACALPGGPIIKEGRPFFSPLSK